MLLFCLLSRWIPLYYFVSFLLSFSLALSEQTDATISPQPQNPVPDIKYCQIHTVIFQICPYSLTLSTQGHKPTIKALILSHVKITHTEIHTHALAHACTHYPCEEGHGSLPAVCMKSINNNQGIMYGKQNIWPDQLQLPCLPLIPLLSIWHFFSLFFFVLSPLCLSIFLPSLLSHHGVWGWM